MDKFKIEKLYAFIADNPEGEGVVGATLAPGQWMPFVGADMDRVESLRPLAKDISKTTGMKITLCVFSVRTEIEVIE